MSRIRKIIPSIPGKPPVSLFFHTFQVTNLTEEEINGKEHVFSRIIIQYFASLFIDYSLFAESEHALTKTSNGLFPHFGQLDHT